MMLPADPPLTPPRESAWAIFLIFLRLGLTSFGGPVAHIGYFRHEFVVRRAWLSEAAYAELVAICQFLPGPASSQVGMALGLQRAGHRGALAAWMGFTLPSALVLIALALGLARWRLDVPAAQGALHGLKVVAVVVVAQAVWGMRQLCPDVRTRLLALGTAALVLAWPTPWTQVVLMAMAAALGARWWVRPAIAAPAHAPTTDTPRRGGPWLALFFALLLTLPLAVRVMGASAWPALALADAFYRAGALVFGGGHVVLPLLQAEVVPAGWVDESVFLAGYGAAQAVPGPLFTFAAFLGAARTLAPTGWAGGLLALLAIFLPAYLLVAGSLPFWEHMRTAPRARAAMAAVNAGVVGLLLAALIDPVGTHGLRGWADVALAALALWALMRWRAPPWMVVLVSAAVGVASATAAA